MFCKSGEDLQLCPSGGPVGDTGGIVATGVIVTWHLCDPSECFVCILAIRSGVFSASAVRPRYWPQLDTRGFQKKRLLHNAIKILNRQKGSWIGRCTAVRRSCIAQGEQLKIITYIENKLEGCDKDGLRSRDVETGASSIRTLMENNQRDSDIHSGGVTGKIICSSRPGDNYTSPRMKVAATCWSHFKNERLFATSSGTDSKEKKEGEKKSND